MSNSTFTFLSAMTAGIVIGILTSPLEGKRFREILFSNDDDGDEWGDRDTFSLKELVSNDSISFEELKERILRENGS